MNATITRNGTGTSTVTTGRKAVSLGTFSVCEEEEVRQAVGIRTRVSKYDAVINFAANLAAGKWAKLPICTEGMSEADCEKAVVSARMAISQRARALEIKLRTRTDGANIYLSPKTADTEEAEEIEEE